MTQMVSTPREYGTPIRERFDALNYSRTIEGIVRDRYEEVAKVGDMLWNSPSEDSRGLHLGAKAMRTGLLGQLTKARDLDDTAPLLRYKQVPLVIGQYNKYFAAYGYNKENVDYDELHGVTVDAAGDLGEVSAYTEELLDHKPFVMGETFVSGWMKRDDGTRIPMFADDLRIIGDSSYRSSNILRNAAGPSYSLLEQLDQYGYNQVTHEGRPATFKVSRILTSPMVARELRILYGATTNIEQSNPNVANPTVGSTPTIVETPHLANANDMIVFYDGAEKELNRIFKYRSKQRTWDEPNPEYLFTEIATRVLYYFLNQSRVLFVPGQ